MTEAANAILTDDDLRQLWRNAGGDFHGPKVETGTMPEADLLPFLASLVGEIETLRARLSQGGAGGVVDFLSRLREANTRRNDEYRAKTQGEPLPLLFRTTEFAGEVGELLNVVKKIERERLGWSGKRASREDLIGEFGGVGATLDLLAMDLGVDLAEAIASEFNSVSDRLGLSTKLDATPPATPVPPASVEVVRDAVETALRRFGGIAVLARKPNALRFIAEIAAREVAALSHPAPGREAE